MQFSRIFKPSLAFKIDNFFAMTVGTSNCWTVNMKLLTRTVQTETIETFGKEKVRKTVIFLDNFFVVVIFTIAITITIADTLY